MRDRGRPAFHRAAGRHAPGRAGTPARSCPSRRPSGWSRIISRVSAHRARRSSTLRGLSRRERGIEPRPRLPPDEGQQRHGGCPRGDRQEAPLPSPPGHAHDGDRQREQHRARGDHAQIRRAAHAEGNPHGIPRDAAGTVAPGRRRQDEEQRQADELRGHVDVPEQRRRSLARGERRGEGAAARLREPQCDRDGRRDRQPRDDRRRASAVPREVPGRTQREDRARPPVHEGGERPLRSTAQPAPRRQRGKGRDREWPFAHERGPSGAAAHPHLEEQPRRGDGVDEIPLDGRVLVGKGGRRGERHRHHRGGEQPVRDPAAEVRAHRGGATFAPSGYAKARGAYPKSLCAGAWSTVRSSLHAIDHGRRDLPVTRQAGGDPERGAQEARRHADHARASRGPAHRLRHLAIGEDGRAAESVGAAVGRGRVQGHHAGDGEVVGVDGLPQAAAAAGDHHEPQPACPSRDGAQVLVLVPRRR